MKIFRYTQTEEEKKRLFKSLIDRGGRGLLTRLAKFVGVSDRRARAWKTEGEGWATVTNEEKIEEFLHTYYDDLEPQEERVSVHDGQSAELQWLTDEQAHASRGTMPVSYEEAIRMIQDETVAYNRRIERIVAAVVQEQERTVGGGRERRKPARGTHRDHKNKIRSAEKT